MLHTELLEPFSRFLPVILILIGAMVLVRVLALVRGRGAARKRAARRRTNIAYRKAWYSFFGRDKVAQLTHKPSLESDIRH